MKTLKLVIAIIIATVFTTNSSNAQSAMSITSNDPFTVNYKGEANGYLLFEVGFDANGKNKTLKITDKQDGELYEQFFSTSNTKQIYKIEKKEGQVLVFNFTNNNKEYNVTYTYNTEITEKVTLVQNVVATKK
jgi:hypothetical protein